MRYIRESDQQTFTAGQIKKMHSNTSFSKVVDTFADLGYYEIDVLPKPEPSSPLKRLVKTDPVKVGGVWQQGWAEEDIFSGETKAEQEAAYLEKLEADALAAAIEQAKQDFIAETEELTAGYSQAEIDTFPVQEAEAKAYTADNTAPTPLIDAIISESGESKADLVASILAKAGLLKVGVGKALGRKRKSTP